jgi:hypothetical protein
MSIDKDKRVHRTSESTTQKNLIAEAMKQIRIRLGVAGDFYCIITKGREHTVVFR